VDIEDSIIDLTDAIGNDYTDLAPEGQAHFDPVTVATILACHILYAIGAGIKEGITEAAKDGTVAVIRASGRHIGDRLVPSRLRQFFTAQPDPAGADTNADARRSAAEKQAGDSLAGAAAAAGQLDPAAIAELAAATAAAVAQALHSAGLKDTATIRVQQTIETQVKVTLTPLPQPG
jgi:hypothetical protein